MIVEFISGLALIWVIVGFVAIFAVGILAAEIESWLLGAAALLGFGVFMAAFGMNPANMVFTFTGFILLLSYILIGGLYVYFYSWPLWLDKNKDKINRYWDDFRKKNPESTAEDFLNDYTGQRFRPSSNVNYITNQMVLWPFDLFWELLHKPITWAYNEVYRIMGDLLWNRTKNYMEKNIKK
jgi:hypothetical protein